MAVNYKIYYNDSYLLLSDEQPQMNENYCKIIATEEATATFVREPHILFDGSAHTPILLLNKQPQKILETLSARLDTIKAGGGIIFNEHRELLLIYRRGKWDMPKGKIEAGERIIDGAIREVREETGITPESVNPKAVITYHVYALHGKYCMKETS